MAYLYYLICALAIATIETVGFAQLFGRAMYDLQIPLIIAISVLGRPKPSFGVIVILAAIMDTLSGGPFGIYLTTYIWLFLLIKALLQVVSLYSFWAVALLSVVGVLLENSTFIFIQLLGTGEVYSFKSVILPFIIKQCLLAFFTSPLIMFALAKGHTLLQGFERQNTGEGF